MEPSPAPTAPDELDVRSCTVLLADDNEQNLELIHAYLEDLGCRVVTARDGLEAVEAVSRHQPDLVLLDVMMPRMSGFQACVKIKQLPAARDVPVIMVTALSEVSDVERAVESGADDFLTKPVNRLELLTRVRSLLRVARLKRDLHRAVSEVRRLRAETGNPEPGSA